MSTISVYQRAGDNILYGGTWGGTAPSSGYAVSTLGFLNPAERVRYGSATVTPTCTIGGALQGDILCIPMHNLTPGSSAVLTLTNNNGFSHAIPVPALLSNGFPPTLVVDLTGFASAGTRTATVWSFVIASNAANVVLGGAIAIYGPKRTFSETVTGSFSWQYTEKETGNMIETPNEYMTPYVQDYGTVSREIDILIVANSTGITSFRNWFRSNHGRVFPSLFWPDTSVVDGYFGRWQKTLTISPMQTMSALRSMQVSYEEWPKGKVIT